VSSQESAVAVTGAEATNKVDVVKCFESCILNINLTNVNAFFIADKRGKYVCVSNACCLMSSVFRDAMLCSPLEVNR
jgi:hypothetical protein